MDDNRRDDFLNIVIIVYDTIFWRRYQHNLLCSLAQQVPSVAMSTHECHLPPVPVNSRFSLSLSSVSRGKRGFPFPVVMENEEHEGG
jgi:hypothetical protein